MSKNKPTVGKITQLTDTPRIVTEIKQTSMVSIITDLQSKLDDATNELAYIGALVGAVPREPASDAVERFKRENKNKSDAPNPTLHSDFIDTFNQLQSQAYQNAKNKGWWKERELLVEVATAHSPELGKFAKLAVDAMSIALKHAELSEALEYLRHGNPPSDHIPDFSGAEEEDADTIIRIMDGAAHNNHRVAEAIVAKMEFNQGRAYKHGNKAF